MLLDVVDLHHGDEDTCKYKYTAKEEVVSCLDSQVQTASDRIDSKGEQADTLGNEDAEVTIEQAHGVTEQEVLRPGKKRGFYASV